MLSLQAMLTKDILKSGLVLELDATITMRGRERRVGFPHKLFQDYFFAFYIMGHRDEKQDVSWLKRIVQYVPLVRNYMSRESNHKLKKWFPTLAEIMNHKGIVMFCCGLSKEDDATMHYIIEACIEHIRENCYLAYYGDYYSKLLSTFQNECRDNDPKFVIFPSDGLKLSELMNSAELVYMKDLFGIESDSTQPCHAKQADIIIDLHSIKWDFTDMTKTLVTLHNCKPRILGVRLDACDVNVVNHVCSLLPSPYLMFLHILNSPMPATIKEVMPARSPELTDVHIHLSNTELLGTFSDSNPQLQRHLIGDALNALTSQCKVRSLKMRKIKHALVSDDIANYHLLKTMTIHFPHLKKIDLDFKCTDYTGSVLAGFMENPPPTLEILRLLDIRLQEDDIRSMTSALKAGQLRNLKRILIGLHFDEHQNKPCILPHSLCNPLLESLAKCRQLEDLFLCGNNFLSGFDISSGLVGFLQNPPVSLQLLRLSAAVLLEKDIESLTQAVKRGKLQNLKFLSINNIGQPIHESVWLPLQDAVQQMCPFKLPNGIDTDIQWCTFDLKGGIIDLRTIL